MSAQGADDPSGVTVAAGVMAGCLGGGVLQVLLAFGAAAVASSLGLSIHVMAAHRSTL